jgi:hypothetical protein
MATFRRRNVKEIQMSTIKTGLAATAVIVVSVAGGVLGIALPAQANPVITHAIMSAFDSGSEDGSQDGSHDGETADDNGVEDGTNDGETADDGVEDGTNDGETADDAGN